MTGRDPRTLLLAFALGLAPLRAAAMQLEDGKLTIGLAGDVAYGKTDGNTYTVGNKEGDYDNAKLAVSIVGQLSDQLRVFGRFDMSTKEGTQVDWAFAEWKASDALRLRAGKAKHAFGNYGEIIEEGTLRPFFDPPQTIYGPVDMVGFGYTGLGITGFHRFGRWGLTYDLYGGMLDVETSNAIMRINDPALNPAEGVALSTRDMVGARLTLDTPPGLVVRLSGYTGTEERFFDLDRDIRHTTAAASLEYLGEALSLRAEYAYMIQKTYATTSAGYAELAWKFPVGIQLAARVEGSWTTLEGFTGTSPNLRHREAAGGVNYWFDPNFVVRFEYHLVDGNRLAYAPWPDEGGLPSPIPEPSAKTQLILVGVQFSL